MKKPHILIIDNSIGVTGALKSITRTAYDLKLFYDFSFVIPRNSEARSWISQNGFTDISELNMKEISKRFSSVLYFPYLVRNALKLMYTVRKKNVDLIHVNDVYNLLPTTLRILGSKTPYVCHIRFLPDKFPRIIFNFWLNLHLRFARKIVVVSQYLFKQLPVHDKIIYIPNELPVEDRYPITLEIDRERDSHSFLYLANFIEGKGQNYALQAFYRVHQQLPGWRLRFIGGDLGLSKNKIFRERLIETSTELGISEKIDWKGFTEDVEREYKEADIVLNFSESESFSITCLEALYFGRALIATDCGGPAEIVEHKRSGILVENKSVDAMANAMLQLALNKPLRLDLGTAARAMVKEKFSVEKTSYRLREVYRDTLNNR